MFRRAFAIVALTLASTAVLAECMSLEPCINGDVSRSGNYPSQDMEEQINAYLKCQESQPFYLFRIAGRNLPKAYRDE